MNEQAFAKRLITTLDDSLEQLRPEVVHRLESARQHACAHAGEKHGVHAIRSAHGVTLVAWVRHHRVGAVGLLLAMLLGIAAAAWQYSGSPGDDTSDIDAGLLTDELPVNAYLDNHLNKWVNSDSQ